MKHAWLWTAAVLVAIAAGSGAGAEQTGTLRLGIGASVITPYLDQPMAGYYYARTADGVHDDLHARALVFDDGRAPVVLVACETIGMPRSVVVEARRRIEKQLGIPPGRILISATHCHTGPQMTPEYEQMLARRIGDAIVTASGRKQPARLFAAAEQEGSLPHYRRYLMKDGSVRTNPGFLNPDVVKPVGPIDPRVGVLFAEDQKGDPLLTWVNYAMHLDSVGSTWISADYPSFLARFLERLKGTEMSTVFTIGAAGNINNWDVRRPGPQRGYDTARRLGEVLGAAVVKASTHLEPVSPPHLRAISATLSLPPAAITSQEVEEARKILATPPPPNVDFTIDRVQAAKVMGVHALEGKNIEAELQVISIGHVALVGIPGELFVELGLEIQKRSPFAHTFIIELANDTLGYIPTRQAFLEGSYEPTSTRFAPGAGEAMANKAIELLKQLKAER